MPNYEIYFGDAVAALDVIDRRDRQPVAVDSTDFYVERRGSQLVVLRDGADIGHITATITSGTLSLGKLLVTDGYRKKGVPMLLVFLALVHGVRRDAVQVDLNEYPEQIAMRFWGHLGLQMSIRRSMTGALDRFEQYQAGLANRLGLARSPRTLLLDTDRPTGGSSSSSTTSSVKQRRKSF